jgi:TolB protein
MMKTRIGLTLVLAAAVAVMGRTSPDGNGLLRAAPLGPAQQDEVALALRNPGTHPRVGLPDFVMAGGTPELAATAKTIADVLWHDIDFEREYYMIPRATTASVPVVAVAQLPYDRWSELGADFVLAGTVTPTGANAVAIELRLVGVKGESQGRQYFGMRYECGLQTARGPRDCAHSIADDFHKQNRNLDGVARTKIAYSSDRDATRVAGRPSQTAAQGKEIYISDYDGANQMRFTVNRSLNISPAWSPTGALLAYTSYSSGFPDIYVADLARPGRALERPAHGSDQVQNQLPAWSPDGQRLAFMSNRSGNNDIWVVNRDGSGMQNLTNHPANDWAPTWSPDGGKIAFASDRAGANQLYVMNATGTGVQRLLDQKIDRPTWSRLNFIAFTVGAGPGYEIGIYDFGNPGVRILTDGIGSNESPAIAPNGRHIAFVTTRWGHKQIAIMDRTGQNVQRITEAGDNTYPNWQPLTGR